MCQYCNLDCTADKQLGKEIKLPEYECSSTHICRIDNQYFLLYKDYENEEHYIPIEYCPKCGRKLYK